MVEREGDPASAGSRQGKGVYSAAETIAFMRGFTNCSSAASLATATNQNINKGSSTSGNGASPSQSRKYYNTTSNTRVAVETKPLSWFLSRVLHKRTRESQSTSTGTTPNHWDAVPDAFRDSGIDFDNNTLTDRLETGCWDEDFIRIFDNEQRTFIDTKDKLKAFLPILLQLEESLPEKPELSCDCEGCNLGRHGSLTIFQMRVRSLKHTYVFDVLALGGKAMFELEGNGGQSLKKAMESLQAKVFWDTRQDSDAMLHHFGIRLGGVVDAQLMEIATRSYPQRDKVSSLKDAVLVHGKAWMTGEELWEWRRTWNEAKDYFNESRYECFNVRPLSYQALMYSAGDVDCIEKLYDILLPKMNERFWGFVHSETDARVALSLLEVMPGGSNLAPASISNIPYKWPAPLSGWAEDPDSHSSTGASSPSTVANSINMTDGSATDTSRNSGKTTTNRLAMSVARATQHEAEGLMPNSGADVGCQEWTFPK